MNKIKISAIVVASVIAASFAVKDMPLFNLKNEPVSVKDKEEKPYKAIDSIKQLKRIELPKEVESSHTGRAVEYFSFTCIHCKNVSPLVKDANKRLVNNIDTKHLVGKGNELNNNRFKLNETLKHFSKPSLIEDAFTLTMERNLSSPKEIEEFIVANDPKGEMIEYFNSEALELELEKEIKAQGKFTIPGTPYFVIDGSHTVDLETIGSWKEGVKGVEKAITLTANPKNQE